MAYVTSLPGDLIVPGTANIAGGISPLLARTSVLAQTDLAIYNIPWTAWRVHNAMHTNLPGTAADDDLALIGGTFGTASPSLQSQDSGGATTTGYARAQVALPWNYVTGQTVQLLFHAGMLTRVADASATLDVQCYETDEEVGLVGSPTDLYAASSQSINTTTFADYTFSLTATSLAAGDLLDIRIIISITDAGDAGDGITGTIGAAQLLCDVR